MVPDGTLVFAGSSPADVGFARAFWTSATLPPPLESCIGPAALPREGTLPRKGPCPGRDPALWRGPALWETPPQSEKTNEKERLLEAQSMQKNRVKEKYLQQYLKVANDLSIKLAKKRSKIGEMARRREEILALLRKQREERIAKELISHPHKPKIKTYQVR
ncbi:cilia- and flagella-associated protein HOATZ [Numenius arquata]|uniref:cilia- and flagella-associated protein HOATZ n=1 Tax=Numenius arquata TaxID=31919 RepID=UPI003D3058B3